MLPSLTIEVECVNIPDTHLQEGRHLRLGIQMKQEVQQDVLCEGKPIFFRYTLQVDANPAAETLLYRGSFVFGTRDKPFLYLCWGERNGEQWQMQSRAKIQLDTIPREKVEETLQTGKRIHARIRMTDAKEKPITGSLKPGGIEWL